MAGVAAVAGYLYSRRLARGAVIWREWIVLLAPMVLLSRFLPYLTETGTSLAADLTAWTADPGGFFEAGWLVRAGVIVGAWATAFYSTQDLNAVRVQRGEIPEMPARTIIERAWEGEQDRSIDHTWPLRRLAGRFLQGGVAMILLAALTSTAETQSLSIGAAIELFSFARPSSAVALVQRGRVLRGGAAAPDRGAVRAQPRALAPRPRPDRRERAEAMGDHRGRDRRGRAARGAAGADRTAARVPAMCCTS